jgi:tight adherence protein B
MPHYDSYELIGKERIRFYVLSGIILAGIGYLFYASLVISVLFIGLSYPAERHYTHYLADKRKRELSYQFRDLLYSLSSSFATGRHMQEALEDSEGGLRMIYDDAAPICFELSYMVKRMRESRESEEELLWDFASRSHISDIQSFVDIYSICRKTGGNMEKVVMKTIDVLLDKIDIQREIQLLTAQKRMEAYILITIPFIVILFLQLASPNYLSVMYETLTGRMLMSMALGGILVSYMWSMKLTKIII